MGKKLRRPFYGWVIVAAGFMVMFCSIGIVNNCAGLFTKPVCDDMGFSRGAMALNMTIMAACQMVVALLGGRIFGKFNVKHVMRLCSLTLSLGYFAYSLAPSLPVFYLLSIVVGFSMGGLTAMPLSLLVGNWFNQRRGFAIGVAFMGSGIGGMLFNTLAGQWLGSLGWRGTYQLLGGIAFLVLVPVCWLVIRTKPADMGLVPYGQSAGETTQQNDSQGQTLAQVTRTGRFWTLCLACVLVNVSLCSLNQNIVPHLIDQGYSSTTAANLSALMLGGLALGKMLLGWLYDKLGPRRATLLGNLCTVLAVIGAVFCRFPPMLVAVTLGFSLGNAFGSVAPPILVQSLYGRRDYSAILGILTAGISLSGVFTPVVIGLVYDHFGSYVPAFFVMIFLSILVAASFFLLLSPKRKDASTSC